VGGVAGFLVGRTWGTLITVIASALGVVVVGFVGFVVGAAIVHRVRQRVLGTDELTSLD
jgi:xanthosine utilization system XapX-like protein